MGVRAHENNREWQHREESMFSRLHPMAKDCDSKLKVLDTMEQQLFVRTKRCNLSTLKLFATDRKLQKKALKDTDEVDLLLRRCVRRCQFTYQELKSMYIMARKYSNSPPDVMLDREQFGRIVQHYGYRNEKIVNRLFAMFDEDGSGEIDFDEMVDGLAKLAPSALITHPKTFYDVIKLDGTDEVSRLELLRIFTMLERAPQKDCLNDVSQVFDILNLESNRGLSCWCFCDGVRSDVKLRNVFTKYLTIEGNQKLRLHTVD